MRLKELRKLENKTQSDIAKLLNVSQVNYGKYELGLIEPNIDTLCKLADYYKVSLDYIVERIDNSPFNHLTETEQDLITAFRQLNQINQVKLIAQLQGMLVAQN